VMRAVAADAEAENAPKKTATSAAVKAKEREKFMVNSNRFGRKCPVRGSCCCAMSERPKACSYHATCITSHAFGARWQKKTDHSRSRGRL